MKPTQNVVKKMYASIDEKGRIVEIATRKSDVGYSKEYKIIPITISYSLEK